MSLPCRRRIAAAITTSLLLVLPFGTDASAAQRQPGDRCRVEGRTTASADGALRCTATRRGLLWRRTAATATPTTTSVASPDAPVLVANAPSACEPLRLSWSGANPDTNHYSVQWTPIDRADFNSYTKYNVRGTSVTMPNWFKGDTTYRFRVFAMHSEWNGTWHSTENVTPHSNLVDVRIPVCGSSGGGSGTGGGDDDSQVNVAGTLDATFSTNVGTGANNEIFAQTLQADGKIILGGSITSWGGTAVNRIVRLNSDGTRDTAFATEGTGAISFVHAVATQFDGKILVGGQFTSWNGITVGGIARLNSDGTLDTAFTTNNGLGANTRFTPTPVIAIRAITVQSDGKILVGGDFTTWDGTAVGRIVRLNGDGTRDTTFTTATGTAAGDSVRTIAAHSGGKILVGGDFTAWDGTPVGRIVRLNSDGTLDTAFTTATGTAAGGFVRAIATLPDGKILVAGSVTTWDGATANGIVRLNGDGTRDSTFNHVHNPNGAITSIAAQTNGKIIYTGPAGITSAVTRRERVAGVVTLQLPVNHEFNVGDSLVVTLVSDITNGTYTVTDIPAPNKVSFALAGADIADGPNTQVNAVVTLSVNRLVRLNVDGTRDRDFTRVVGTGANGAVNAITAQGDRKIVFSGNFTTWKGSSAGRVVRLS